MPMSMFYIKHDRISNIQWIFEQQIVNRLLDEKYFMFKKTKRVYKIHLTIRESY